MCPERPWTKMLISCHLEFECTNNTVEYKALVQGLKRAIELKVKYLKVSQGEVWGREKSTQGTLKKYLNDVENMGSHWIPRRLYFLFYKEYCWGMWSPKMEFWWTRKEQNPFCRFPHHIVRDQCNHFFGKINFVRRLIPDFAEIAKSLERMIKKYVQFKWTPVDK